MSHFVSCLKCHLFTPQTDFISRFVSSASVPTDADIPYGPSCILPTMPLTYTTITILFELCILSQRPADSIHSLWAILYFAQNASYTHRRQISIRVLYPQPACGRLRSLPMGHTVSCPECPLHTPQINFSTSFVFSASAVTDPDNYYGAPQPAKSPPN